MLSGLVWTVLVFCLTTFNTSDGLHCFSCSNISEEEDCTNVTQCTSTQKCYAERSGHGNQTKFALGCIESQRCPDHHDFTIVGRSTHDQCMECCVQDGCNKEMCEVKHVSDVHNPRICVDDPATNCTQLSNLINICSDIHHAKNVCRKHCGLCSLVDGDWNLWSGWTPCSTTCGVGIHSRRRMCSNPVPQNKGAPCTGTGTQTHSCFDRACPVHGGWDSWLAWEACSVSCGEGVKKRHRTCTNPAPSVYGHFCIGDAVDFDICHEQSCNNLTKSNTTHHSSCADVVKECNVLNQTVALCSIQQQARTLCARFCGLCSIVDGQWSTWYSWGACSTSCDNGTWSRTRTCTGPAPANGGKPCTGNHIDTGTCNLRLCPVHGGWSPWEHWTTCSSSCGQGITKRLRSCTNPRPSMMGNPCFGDSKDYEMCTVKPCPVDGQWTTWLQWSSCSVTCGSGQKTRQRICSNPGPINGGQNCPGVSTEHITCQAALCPVNGGWSTWSSWSSCSRSCNGGQRNRRRACTNPSPVGLGTPCIGNSDEVSVCNGHPCLVDGSWSSWSSWSSCTKSCNVGEKRRHRTCSHPSPSGAGRACIGNSDDVMVCNTTPCRGLQIGFFASGNVRSSTIVHFTTVKTNYGSGYSSSTGKFTCRYPGLYYFSTSVIKERTSSRKVDMLICDIYKNTLPLITTNIDPTDDDTDKGSYETSAFVVVHLSLGDQVYVKCYQEMESYSSFSGFLIQSD